MGNNVNRSDDETVILSDEDKLKIQQQLNEDDSDTESTDSDGEDE